MSLDASSDAQPSNSGDRYHFAYAARRMLDMLHPMHGLRLLVMEGVGPEDRAFATGTETYLGVDLTEYYDGDSFQSASHTVLVQVKYSAIHPGRLWTLVRLAQDRASKAGRARPGTSVLRKLANMFAASYRALGEDAARRVTVRLHTNQPLDPELREELLRLRSQLAEADSTAAAGRLLRKAKGGIVERLQHVTQLTWAQLAAFLLAWDLNGFGQPMLTRAEAEIFAEVDRFTDGDVPVGSLISFVQEHCQAGRRTKITRRDVYALLRLREEDFFPAPSFLEPAETLFLTQDAARLIKEIDRHPGGILVLQGRGGTGKSSTIQVAAREYAGGAATIIYDCYADGAGLRPGTERYPFPVCFVQIINELESRFRTRIHATTRLSERSLLRRFREAVAAASEVAAEKGHRLVIAIDAIDNAADAAERSPVRAGQSFVPLLWTLDWPENCVVVVSTRPENRPLLHIPAGPAELDCEGFTPDETELHVARRLPDAPAGLDGELHRRTRGTPRVQTRILDSLAAAPVADPFAFVQERARENAFEFYREECRRRVDSRPDLLLLAVVHQATQFLQLTTLARVLKRDPREVEAVVHALAFGLRHTPEGAIAWQDQDFLDFVGEFARAEQEEARAALADYCLANHGAEPYARANLSRHLHLAGRHEELLRWCLDEGRLEERIREVEPHGEDALGDVEYALLSATATGRMADALALLALAAEIVQGRDLFVEKLWNNLPAAIGAGYTDRLLDDLSDTSPDAHAQLHLARALAESGHRPDTAVDLRRRALIALEQEAKEEEARRTAAEDEVWPPPIHEVFSDEVVLEEVLVVRWVGGFRAALERMQDWSPPESIAGIYADLCRTWQQEGDLDPVRAIQEVVVDPAGRCFACLGLLAAPARLAEGVAEAAVTEILASIASAEPTPSVVRPALIGLLRSGHARLAATLLPQLDPRPPGYVGDQGTDEFLLARALRAALADEPFDPLTFGQQAPDGPRRGDPRSEDELRGVLARQYPARLVYVKALLGGGPEELRDGARSALRSWREGIHFPGWQPYTGVTEAGEFLAEAIVLTQGYHPDLIRDLRHATERVLSDVHGAFARYATILAADERYPAEAERLIVEVREQYRPPLARADDAVEMLLALCRPAALFDGALADALFADARLLAGELDAEITGRSHALLRSLERSGLDGVPDADLAVLGDIYRYMSEAEGSKTSVPESELLRLLARTRPRIAFRVAAHWETHRTLELGKAVVALVHGLLEGGTAEPEALWPLVHLAPHHMGEQGPFRRVIERISASGGDPGPALATCGRLLRTHFDHGDREAVAEMVEWADGLGLSHPEVERMRSFARSVRAFGEPHPPVTLVSVPGPPEPPALWHRARSLLHTSPAEASAVLRSASARELAELRADDLRTLLAELGPCLSTVQAIELLDVVERWADGADEWEAPRAISLVGALMGPAPPPRLAQAALGTAERLLTARTIEDLAGRTTSDRGEDSLAHPVFAGGMGILVSAAARRIRSLSAQGLQLWVARLSAFLSRDAAASLFRILVARARARLPEPPQAIETGAWAQPDPLAGFICDLMGHPRTEVRWRALYALADQCIDGPAAALDAVIRELGDDTHPRWMTRREWLAFLVEHLSLRRPEPLVPYAPLLLSQATDPSFPHAKIRHHLREALLRVEAARPGTLTREEMERVRALNQPVRIGGERHRARQRFAARRRERPEGPFHFDETDTLRYWYDPLANCFVEPESAPEEIAFDWIVRRWGITEDLCRDDPRSQGYEWRETGHSHYSQPAVETLCTYAERHALFVAAGTLIETAEVAFDGEREGDRWSEWVRSHLRQADPALPGRYVDAPPLMPENFGYFGPAFDRWAEEDSEDEYLRQLRVGEGDGWVVVAAEHGGHFGSRTFQVSVWSALLDMDSPDALRELYQPGEEPVLPWVHLSGATWPECEHDLEHRSDYYVFVENGVEDWDDESEPETGLHCWLVRFEQELALEFADPHLPARHREWAAFHPDVLRDLCLTRKPAELLWRDAHGRVAAYLEVWHPPSVQSHETETAQGYRLVLRRDLAAEYARQRRLDIVFLVTIDRERAARGEDSAATKYDVERSGVHLLIRPNGELV